MRERTERREKRGDDRNGIISTLRKTLYKVERTEKREEMVRGKGSAPGSRKPFIK